MVCRDAKETFVDFACGISPEGESPESVSRKAPNSRSQARGEIHVSQAGCQKPARRRKSSSREQAHGPQHEVKPAASTEEQSGSRAAHFTAKATSEARAEDSGGVRGAARVQGGMLNTRDPSAQSQSRQERSHKSKTKTS